MGDSGSQFLGFTLGFLAIRTVEKVDPTFAPAAVLLLLGLPIADIIAVLLMRMRKGENWFRATRNHIHHRLLDLGFIHQESVVLIYSAQIFFVTSAILLRHRPEWISLLIKFTSIDSSELLWLSLRRVHGFHSYLLQTL